MSAICGVLHLNNEPVCAETLEPVMAALGHYGPDGRSAWRQGHVGLGHQMMHITPESLHEPLPWRHPHLDLTITADARIDNREDLFAAFAIPQHCRATMPDSQLILFAYEHWGQQCPRHLLGDFSFAIWDGRTQTLFCARDPLGVKPFYYCFSGALFAFASDIRGVLACPGVPRRPNMSFIAAYLYYATFRSHVAETFHKDVRKLPPAQTLTANAAGVRRHVYLDWEAVPPLRLAADADYADMLHDLLSRAVQCRLRSVYPVGAHLSGGFDSSLITVLAARYLREMGQQLKAFSWSPPPTDADRPYQPDDERYRVEAVAMQEAIPVYYTELLAEDIWAWYTRDVSTRPTIDVPDELATSRDAAAANIRVMLSGWGGDQGALPLPNRYFTELLRQGFWGSIWRELTGRNKRRRLQRFWQEIKRLLFSLLPERLFWMLQPNIARPGWPGLLQPAMLERLRHVAPLEFASIVLHAGKFKNHASVLDTGFWVYRLEAWAADGADYGIEYRYPLLDRRIVEFGLAAPANQFFRDGWGRFLMHCVAEQLLPDALPWSRIKQEPAARQARQTLHRAVSKEVTHHLADGDEPGQQLYCLDKHQLQQLHQSPDNHPNSTGMAQAIRCEYIWQQHVAHFRPFV